MSETDLALAASIHAIVERYPGISVVYLFGSRARGDERAASDVDLGVLFGERPAPTLDGPVLDLESRLEVALGLPVQLVSLNDAPPDLAHRVLRDGRILFEADRSHRIRFEVRARNEYFDLLPVLQRYRSAALTPA